MIKSSLILLLTLLALPGVACSPSHKKALPTPEQIDAAVQRVMQGTGARGLALAVIDDGQIVQVSVYGDRNDAGDPLEKNSIMYAASLTKTAFAYMVLQLVDDGIIDLDRPVAEYLPRPLPDYTDPDVEDLYARWSDLAGDDRWKQITPRMLLTHSSGFANFGFLEPDGRLRIHFDPGTRYSYSGDGFILLQFVLDRGLGMDVGAEMHNRVFEPLGMINTSLIWRDDFNGHTADGWTADGEPVPHDDRSAVRAAGSMDTTIEDMALLAAAIARGDLLTPQSRAELSRAQLDIRSASQFPVLQDDAPRDQQKKNLSAGLGVVTFEGPQEHGFFKGGHNEWTGNMLVCLEDSKRCVLILGNDLRAEQAIPYLVDFILGNTGVPWDWEYSGTQRWQPPAD